MILAEVSVGDVEIIIIICSSMVAYLVVPCHVHAVIFAVQLEQVPRVVLAGVAYDIRSRDPQLLHTVLESMCISCADSLAVHNCAVCALVVCAACNILNRVGQIIMHQLNFLNVLRQ